MATPDQKSPNVLLQSLCCRILGRSEADVAQQFQYAVRVIGSNFAPTVERDEFLVAEKIKKELTRQRREADAALFSELHRKLHSQVPRAGCGGVAALRGRAPSRGGSRSLSGAARIRAYSPLQSSLLRLLCPHNKRSLPGVRTQQAPPLFRQSHLGPGTGDCLRQQLGARLAWTLTASQPSLQTTTSKGVPSAASRSMTRPRRDGDAGGAVEVTEAALVRDILYVFQGIDGRNIKMSSADNCYKVEGKANLNKSLRDTAMRLAELGWLHNKIRKYTDQRSLDRSFGLVGQSFCAALHQELKEYYRLLSVLHSQLQLEDDQGVNLGFESSLTLRRLLVWTYDPKIRLKTLAALVDHCQGRKGGELASAVHAYTKTGDPSMRSLVQHILSLVSHPVLSFLYRWIYDGELEDTHHEVRRRLLRAAGRRAHPEVRRAFGVSSEQPGAGPILRCLLRAVGRQAHPRASLSSRHRIEQSCVCLVGNAADLFTDLENAFQGKIDAAYFETSKYLLDVLNRKYSLLDHMQAVRRYLLLGQGDFIRHLMDLLKPELARPATTLYQHNLTGILETAVRATNAQFDSPEILKRLDVRLLEVSPGDTGWDVFSLDYHVDGPIATVFTRECMSHYLRVFNFLWRAKRMEYILTDIRKGHMCNAKLLRSLPEFSGVLHHCHILASEMVHFIHQMQYYITFEVLECSWDELWNQVQQAQDLDHIIAAHEAFLGTVISRCLLDSDSRALLNQLRAVFDQIIELQSTQDAICRAALEELQRRLQFEDKKKQREAEGQWGVTAAEEEQENQRIREFRESIPKMCSQLRILTHFYQGVVQQFLVLLTTSSDESLRFLSFRLDFNEHYRAREPRLRVSLGARGRRSSHT
ncbi:hypothetical protein E5288_WYG011533 [Bos mutus]|uniref:Uncharacterized protein n=1 Tax=Bos mutus TaxID=72004 RepID=A0A6B0RNU8_9CETA|nr:hypothetical protein [Bos mutus]